MQSQSETILFRKSSAAIRACVYRSNSMRAMVTANPRGGAHPQIWPRDQYAPKKMGRCPVW